MDIESVRARFARPCACGRVHEFPPREVLTEPGCLAKLPSCVRKLGGKPFVVSDPCTEKACGGAVKALLRESGIPFADFVIPEEMPSPDEKTAGVLLLHFDPSCDLILGVGSGVINDCCKLLAAASRRPFLLVATAPSMDGFCSDTSSMDRDGLKVSIPSHGADLILGDPEILREAPMDALLAGLGDMLAKYVSLCEWRISELVTGEYYCGEVADLVREALRRCAENAEGLVRRETEAVRAVMEGLVLGGLAMSLAGCSRPASGAEHYISHLMDMRSLAFGSFTDRHGLNCAFGTLEVIRRYEKLMTLTPDPARARRETESFDLPAWQQTLRTLIGPGALAMEALEEKEGKYRREHVEARQQALFAHWDEIRAIIREELPPYGELLGFCRKLGLPTEPAHFGLDRETLGLIFRATKDIRNKYILSMLAWDLGLLEEIAE